MDVVTLSAAKADAAKRYPPTSVAGALALKARRLLAAAAINGPRPVSSLAPTITVTQNVSVTTISGGVRIAPKMTTTVADPDRDPNFLLIGCPSSRIAPTVTTPDIQRPDYLTGGTSQAARFAPRWAFVHTGSVFELSLRFFVSALTYRLWIDGRPLTADMVTVTTVAGQRGLLKVDFGSVDRRHIMFEMVDPGFGGVFIEVTGSVTRPDSGGPLVLAGFGDSHTGGANGVSRNETYVARAAAILNMEWTNLGIGGSGYLQDNGTTGANYRNRITPDIVASNPDVLVFEGSWNDGSSTTAAVRAEALYCFQQLKTLLPNTILIAAGPWVTNWTLNALLDAHDAALRSAAQEAGLHGYISYRDPKKLKDSAPEIANGTTYSVGDVVVNSANGFAWSCTVAHTYAGSSFTAYWRSTALVTGNGKAGSTNGTGNADVIVSSDGVHNTARGHMVKAGHVSAEILRIARAIAAGTAWAG